MALFGLVKRKELWVPTLRGWFLAIMCLALLTLAMMWGVVPFLAPSQPIDARILVVEGWLPDYALAQAKVVFEQKGYKKLLVTGIPIEQGLFIAKATNYAHLASATLLGMGMKTDVLTALACPEAPRNRTYATARRVRNWLETQAPQASVDVFTLGVHARRTLLLYRIALGPEHRVGVIAGNDQRFDPVQWWRTSSGVRTVTSEAIAYLYAKLIFSPGNAEALADAKQSDNE
jgi:hypothetical protein